MNAVSTYDFTSFNASVNDTKTLCNKHCKKWDFQQEKCPETGRLHLQGRMHLSKKERLTGVIKKFPGFHLSVTTKENQNNNYYVTKEDSRVAGPWSSEDEDAEDVFFIPRQIQGIELRSWQQQVCDSAKVFDKRTVNVIIDTKGCSGKSTLTMWCRVYKIGCKIPFANDFKDIMRMVMNLPVSKLYLFDLPRGIKKDQLYQFFSGIEEIKNGYAFDDRYKFREKFFDSPQIWVFTNAKPDIETLSADRWRLWTISNNHELIPYRDDFIDPIPDAHPPLAPEDDLVDNILDIDVDFKELNI